MDSPGYDPASVTGQIASGCNLVTFTTGRGSAFGSKPSPCVKIATNTEMYTRLIDDMDINAGAMLTEDLVLKKKDVKFISFCWMLPLDGNQNLKHKDWVITNLFPWQIGATM